MDKEMKSIFDRITRFRREQRKGIVGSADSGEQSDRRIGFGRI